MSLALVIDARGDSIVKEVGFDKRWPAREIFNGGGGHGILINNAGTPSSQTFGELNPDPEVGIIGLWNPPLSDWMLPRPRQFEPDWTSSSDYSYHVVGKDNWLFDIDVHETSILGTPETSDPNDKWIQFVSPSSPINLKTVNFDNIAATVGRASLPASMMMAGVTNLPVRGSITPFFQWLRYPDPEDVIIFGFGQFAIYNDSHFTFLIRNTDFPSLQKWEPVWGQNGSVVWNFDQNSQIPPLSWAVQRHGIMVIPVGLTDLYLMRDPKSHPWIATVRNQPTVRKPSEMVKNGQWWIACAGNQKVVFQAQTMAYGYAQHWPVINTDPRFGGANSLRSELEWFNLGQEYTPNSDGDPAAGPFLSAASLVHIRSSDTTTTPPIPSGTQVNNDTDGQSLTVQLLDEEANGWTSDGTHFRGTMRIQIQPNSSGGATLFGQDCWTPQIRDISCKIPPKLIERPFTELVLRDQVHYNSGNKIPGGFKPNWSYSSSLKEPRSKRLGISLTSYGAAMLVDAGLADKHDYSIVIVNPPDDTYDALGNVLFPGSIGWDDTNKQYIGEMIRAWVEEPPNFGELAQMPIWSIPTPSDFPPPTGGAPNLIPPTIVGHYAVYDAEIHARGMMERADEPWLFMSLLQAPLNAGSLLHTDAVTTAFQQSGFDPTNPHSLFIGADDDPLKMQILPGYAVTKFGESGMVQNEGYAPDWNEGKLEYAWRVANEWKKWLLYEEMGGRITYRADPLDQIYKNMAVTLPLEATFYRTKADAASAGQDSRQVYHTASRLFTHPVAHNVVRVIPAKGTLPQVVIQDLRGCKQPNPSGTWSPGFGDPSYENFVGYTLRPEIVHPKMGNDLFPLYQIAVMALLRWRRRIISRVWSCDMRPDEIGIAGVSSGIEIGSVVGVEDAVPGNPSRYQIVKMELIQMGHRKYRTTLTGEILPSPPSVGGL